MNIGNRITRFLGPKIQDRFNPAGRSPILYFHRVLLEKDKYYKDDITVDELDKLLSCLSEIFTFAPLDKLNQHYKGGKPLIGITFDDGYLDNYINALPVLKKHNAFATIFVATSGIEKGVLWNDLIKYAVKEASDRSIHALERASSSVVVTTEERVMLCDRINATLKYLPLRDRNARVASVFNRLGVSDISCPRLMMNSFEIDEMSKEPLITIGAHTHDHTILTTLNELDCAKQISKSKDILEGITGNKIKTFCYPNGRKIQDYSSYHKKFIEMNGFDSAYTTMDGGVDGSVDKFEQPRFLPYRKIPFLMALSAMKIAGEVA